MVVGGWGEEGVDVDVLSKFPIPKWVVNGAGEWGVMEVGGCSMEEEISQFTGPGVVKETEEGFHCVLPWCDFEHVGDVWDKLGDG